MRPFSTRQLFAAMLLASVVLGLFSARPLLSAATLKSRLDSRIAHPARFGLDRPPSRLIRPLSGARRVLAIADSVAERRGGG